MNMRRSSFLRGIAVISAGVLMAAAAGDPSAMAQTAPKPEKLCPISFHLFPSTSLQNRFARDTEKTNARLAQDLVDWRTAKALLPGYEEDRKKLAGSLADAYAGTYLERPVLWDENGAPHAGWIEILTYLGTVFAKAHYIHPQSVNVYLEYVPLENQTVDYMKAKLVNLKGALPGDVDFLANIRTVLAYAPYDDPLLLGNESPIPHRKVCDPIY